MEHLPYGTRLRITAENRRIAKAGSYTLPGGETVTLPRSAEAVAAETVLLLPEQTEEISRPVYRIAEHTWKADTVSAVLALRDEGITGEIIALNFANAMFPCGGYVLGGDAQEESLCRAGLLYAAISPHREYYRRHRLRPTPLYSDAMLYSPDVPLFRRSDGTLLPHPELCSFLTCAAVNRNFARLLLTSEKRITAAMERRITGIVCAIAARRPAAAVLGAFGCGMFGNRRETVFPLMEAAVSRYMPPETDVVFAMPGGGSAP